MGWFLVVPVLLHPKHSHEKKNSTINKKHLGCHKLALFLNFTNHYTQQACWFLHFASTKLRVLFPQTSRPHCHSNVLSHYHQKNQLFFFPIIQQLHPPYISNHFCLGTNNLFCDTTGSDDSEMMNHRIFFWEVLLLNHLCYCANGITSYFSRKKHNIHANRRTQCQPMQLKNSFWLKRLVQEFFIFIHCCLEGMIVAFMFASSILPSWRKDTCAPGRHGLLLLWKVSIIQGVSGSLLWASNGSLDCEIVVLPLSLATQSCRLPCFLMSSIQCGLSEGKALLSFPRYELCMRLSMSSKCMCCNTIIFLLTIEIPSGPKPDDQPIEQLAWMSNYMEAFYPFYSLSKNYCQ